MKSGQLDNFLKQGNHISQIKEKIREFEHNNLQKYNSICYEVEEQHGCNVPKDNKNRRKSKKQQFISSSSKKLVRSQSRCNSKNSSSKITESDTKHNISSIYGQLMAVKSEYKKLKGSYEKLSQEKLQLTARGLSDHHELKQKIQQTQKELEKYKKNNQML